VCVRRVKINSLFYRRGVIIKREERTNPMKKGIPTVKGFEYFRGGPVGGVDHRGDGKGDFVGGEEWG